jgi:hypothetical protein|tara:strand:+ start:644 stop:1303 length:660 start_codon:yes stop_codon:yes gene_type:complete
MNPLDRAQQFLKKIDAEMKSRAGKTAVSAEAMANAAGDYRRAERAKAIMGRGVNERADMLGARLAEARRMRDVEPVQTGPSSGVGPSSPMDLRQLMQSAGLSGTGGKGKYTNKGAMQAPDLDEAALRNAVMNAPGGGQPMAQVMAAGEGPGMMEMIQRARAGIAQNMSRDDSTGQLSRGAAGAAIAGGITASGAALIDLMQFMTQGMNSAQERDDVLPS